MPIKFLLHAACLATVFALASEPASPTAEVCDVQYCQNSGCAQGESCSELGPGCVPQSSECSGCSFELYCNDVPQPRLVQGEPPAAIDGWQAENNEGIRMGPATAAIVITEFFDFQCPYCAALVPRVDSLSAEFPGQIAIVVHHFPLSSHPFAHAAAIAAECAHRQGRFEPFYRALLSDQRSLGQRPWRDYARTTGVSDLEAFDECITMPPDSFPRIAYGRRLGERTGVRGTPALWMNGRVMGRTDLATLRTWAEELSRE
jgi:hypothetical protein